MSRLELASGWLIGHVPARRSAAPSASARDVLERVLIAALRRPPCVVAFSGGRDSSALLAFAVMLARREGLAMPIPATRRYVDDEAADEADWQISLIRHLRITEWTRLKIGDECDLIGPIARPVLRRHGLLWPPAAYVSLPIIELARGGTVMTGEGGDEVFGPHRVSPVRHLFAGRHRLRGARAHLGGSIGPQALRAHHWRRRLDGPARLPWLRPGAREALIDALVQQHVNEPLSWRAATERLAHRRAWIHGAATIQRLADDRDVTMCHPLLDAEFLAAYASNGALLGPVNRSSAMRPLFDDVLPTAVLTRSSKATFNTTLVRHHSRSFAAGWDGGGVDVDLIEPDALRAAWLDPVPNGLAFALLQSAWMATHALSDARGR